MFTLQGADFEKGPTLKWAEFEVGRVVHKTYPLPYLKIYSMPFK